MIVGVTLLKFHEKEITKEEGSFQILSKKNFEEILRGVEN